MKSLLDFYHQNSVVINGIAAFLLYATPNNHIMKVVEKLTVAFLKIRGYKVDKTVVGKNDTTN